MEQLHEREFKQLVKRLTSKEAKSKKAFNMPLKVPSPIPNAGGRRITEPPKKRPDSATRQRTKSATGIPLMAEQELEAFSKSTPIKNLN